MIHLAVEETIFPENLVRAFDQLCWRFRHAAGWFPYRVRFLAHEFKKLEDDFFFVSKVKIQIARRDSEMLRDMICCHRDSARLIEEIDARRENTFAVPGFLFWDRGAKSDGKIGGIHSDLFLRDVPIDKLQ